MICSKILPVVMMGLRRVVRVVRSSRELTIEIDGSPFDPVSLKEEEKKMEIWSLADVIHIVKGEFRDSITYPFPMSQPSLRNHKRRGSSQSACVPKAWSISCSCYG